MSRGFYPTTLVKFRNRLLDHGLKRIGFVGVLNAMREAGYLPKRTRQRLDSSHGVGLVSSMSRLECVRETVRLALEALEPIEWLSRPEFWPVWWERYVDSKLDYKTDAKTLRLKMSQAGRDTRALLRWIREQAASVGRLPRQAAKEPTRAVITYENVVSEKAKGIAPYRSANITILFRPGDLNRKQTHFKGLARAHGMRRCRYRGLAKARLQNLMIGAACNIKRWCRRKIWEQQQPTDSTGPEAAVPIAA